MYPFCGWCVHEHAAVGGSTGTWDLLYRLHLIPMTLGTQWSRSSLFELDWLPLPPSVLGMCQEATGMSNFVHGLIGIWTQCLMLVEYFFYPLSHIPCSGTYSWRREEAVTETITQKQDAVRELCIRSTAFWRLRVTAAVCLFPQNSGFSVGHWSKFLSWD